MKYLITILLICYINILHSQQIPPLGGGGAVIDSATMYLTGTFKQYNPTKAFQINLQNANNGNAKAMNALAIQYTKGLGIDTNFTLAVYWYTQAANNNYTKALVNLGMLYKHKATDSLGYSIACNYFNQALQVAEPSAFFAKGYMLYKGLGCTQSYTAALALFNQGIQINQANCMYFKGLCYKFGYGVSQNNDTANYYIDTAAKLGYQQANAEQANSNNTAARTTRNVIARNEAISIYSRIEKSNNIIQLNGTYSGLLNQFDYSGKKLLAQIPITLSFSNLPSSNNAPSPFGEGWGEARQGVINGSLQLNNNEPINLQAIQQGNQLIFSQTSISTNDKRNKRETRNKKLVFKSAQLAIETKNDSSFLTGNLQLFNTYTHETEKPINIKLTQQVIARNEAISQTQNKIAVFPNPTNGSFTISFNLTKTSPVKINIYNQKGNMVYSRKLENLPKGKQSILCPSLMFNGIYTTIININGKSETVSFIKE